MSRLVEQAASLPPLAYLVLALVALGLVTVLAVTAVVTNNPHRRDAALDALCVLLRRPYPPRRNQLTKRRRRQNRVRPRARAGAPARRQRRSPGDGSNH
jgi:hypothetical protein